jgi:hypothetical protein
MQQGKRVSLREQLQFQSASALKRVQSISAGYDGSGLTATWQEGADVALIERIVKDD